MTEPRFATSRQAKESGWFSRRHETRDANAIARIQYQERHGKEARRRRAEARAFEKSEQEKAA